MSSGPVKVTVLASVFVSDGLKDKSRTATAKRVVLPTRYTDLDATNLTYSVSRGTQSFDIELHP
jgi:hypothetical protein